jgi:hypothetical protein
MTHNDIQSRSLKRGGGRPERAVGLEGVRSDVVDSKWWTVGSGLEYVLERTLEVRRMTYEVLNREI